MSREWQQTRLSNYVMPNAVYYQSIWAVRDLSRMESRLKELEEEWNELPLATMAKEQDTRYKPKNGESLVESNALERAILKERIDGIRDALMEVPKNYRSCIIDNIIFQNSVSIYPNKLWKIWKQKFLFNVAKNLSMW